jgi:hypothetical protein
VPPSIDDAALAAVYRALLKTYHPDVFQGPKEEGERITREIIEAYNVLGNIHNRSAYDATRQAADPDNYPQKEDEEVASEAYVSAKWVDLNKLHAEQLAKTRRQAIIAAAIVATAIIVLASVGQRRQPGPAAAPQEGSSQALNAPIHPIQKCSTPPANGAILTTSASGAGPNVFDFINGRPGNAIVKIRDYVSGAVVVSFFVAAGYGASYNQLPDGRFRIQYALGGGLAQDCRSFAHAYAIYEIPGAETFMSLRNLDGNILHQTLTYALSAEPSRDRNPRPEPIAAKDFDAN